MLYVRRITVRFGIQGHLPVLRKEQEFSFDFAGRMRIAQLRCEFISDDRPTSTQFVSECPLCFPAGLLVSGARRGPALR